VNSVEDLFDEKPERGIRLRRSSEGSGEPSRNSQFIVRTRGIVPSRQVKEIRSCNRTAGRRNPGFPGFDGFASFVTPHPTGALLRWQPMKLLKDGASAGRPTGRERCKNTKMQREPSKISSFAVNETLIAFQGPFFFIPLNMLL